MSDKMQLIQHRAALKGLEGQAHSQCQCRLLQQDGADDTRGVEKESGFVGLVRDPLKHPSRS